MDIEWKHTAHAESESKKLLEMRLYLGTQLQVEWPRFMPRPSVVSLPSHNISSASSVVMFCLLLTYDFDISKQIKLRRTFVPPHLLPVSEALVSDDGRSYVQTPTTSTQVSIRISIECGRTPHRFVLPSNHYSFRQDAVLVLPKQHEVDTVFLPPIPPLPEPQPLVVILFGLFPDPAPWS
jgi:hypothetical protein